MMPRTTTVLALALFALSAHGQDWAEYTNRADRFSLAFPGEPTIEETTYPTESAVLLPARRYSTDGPAGHFVLTVVDYTQAVRVHLENCARLGAAECDGLEAGGDVRGAIAFTASRYRQMTDGEITYDAYAQVDGIPGHQLQITHPDGSRTFVAIHMLARRLYIAEGTVSASAPPPILFQQSLVVLDELGRRIRYTYDDNDQRIQVQPPDPVPGARMRIAALGKRWDDEVNRATREIYTELHHQVLWKGIKEVADVSYGPHALQVLDLFAPETRPAEPGPVLVYFHGGGLTGGDKISGGTDGLIYSNIAKFAASLGGVGINANYRLAPEVEWPAGADDLRLVIDWAHKNAAQYGGDPTRVFVMGNSAGTTHVATYLFNEASQFPDGPRVRGAILASGAFGVPGGGAGRAYYGRRAEERAPLGLVDSYTGSVVPMFIWSTEFDPASIETGVAAMYMKLCVKYQDCPMYTQFQGHNHVSDVMSIGSDDDEVANALAGFLESVPDPD